MLNWHWIFFAFLFFFQLISLRLTYTRFLAVNDFSKINFTFSKNESLILSTFSATNNSLRLSRHKRSPRGARLGGKVSSSLGTNNRAFTRVDGKRNSSFKLSFNLINLLTCLYLPIINKQLETRHNFFICSI